MHHNIGTVVDRVQQDWRGNSVVNDEWNSVACGYRSQCLDVTDVSGRIADALAEYCTRLVVDQLFDRRGIIGFGEADADALAWQNMGE